jgi:hypothetical protein
LSRASSLSENPGVQDPTEHHSRTSRPDMPGYGVLGPHEGSGLLPWRWAAERLAASHDYWLSTVRADGRPHCMPVWGVWDDGLWFSSSLYSRKARNLAVNAFCSVATSDPAEPVVLEGTARLQAAEPLLRAFTARVNAKYDTDYGLDFFDPQRNGVYVVEPHKVVGLTTADFSGSPTRWTFGIG